MVRSKARSSSRRAALAAPALGLALSLGLFGASPAAAQVVSWADQASEDAAKVKAWVTESRDNAGLPFMIVDKARAQVFVFDGAGRLSGSAPALLGMAFGDTTISGIGDRELSNIRPQERTTPAGRFVAALGKDLDKEVLWIDYAAAVSLHRVVTGNPRERRLQRLATASPLDNRISYGCINVPAAYFDRVVKPAFASTHGVVYILPEAETLGEAFPGYDRHDKAARAATATDAAAVANY
jgi:hypothetical protein